MEQKTDGAESYYFVVRGFAPELMRGVAFRREKHYMTRGKKILKCPYCGEEFETVDNDVKVELHCQTKKSKVKYHASIPCRICFKYVGIIYIDAGFASI